MKEYRFVISGGGTGGHIFPALSIADELKGRYPTCDILFVGADGKMEMEKVPSSGYRIAGLPVAGLYRGEILRNLMFLPKLIKSLLKAKKVLKEFRPDVVVGVGGYASAPVLFVAMWLGISTVIQEQNSLAGITNKLLGRRADKISVAYDRMERFFPADKIVLTGNPVRRGIQMIYSGSNEAYKYFGINNAAPIILVIGGSLGARTINQSLLAGFEKIRISNVQVIWQTGSYYYKEIRTRIGADPVPNIRLLEFISRMDLAYSIADVVISRAGAITISELCLVGKPVILVPSPNVAEDHQTRNAMSLVEKEAAILVKDSEAVANLVNKALELVKDKEYCELLAKNIRKLAKPNAAKDIVEVISALLEKRNDGN